MCRYTYLKYIIYHFSLNYFNSHSIQSYELKINFKKGIYHFILLLKVVFRILTKIGFLSKILCYTNMVSISKFTESFELKYFLKYWQNIFKCFILNIYCYRYLINLKISLNKIINKSMIRYIYRAREIFVNCCENVNNTIFTIYHEIISLQEHCTVTLFIKA